MKTYILVDPNEDSDILDKMEMTDQEAKNRNDERRSMRDDRRWVVESVKDFEGNDVNVKNYIQSLKQFPSYGQKVMGIDGRPALTNCCYQEPRCGCRIVGCGTLQFPLAIEFCEKHKDI